MFPHGNPYAHGLFSTIIKLRRPPGDEGRVTSAACLFHTKSFVFVNKLLAASRHTARQRFRGWIFAIFVKTLFRIVTKIFTKESFTEEKFRMHNC
jgi:hypothetical protein